jgi:hypothetical protein
VRRMVAPTLFGIPAKWSDRERCWRWKFAPLVARAYQTPTGGWWISGSLNSFHVGSRAHARIERAAQELERHLEHVYRLLGKVIARRGSR